VPYLSTSVVLIYYEEALSNVCTLHHCLSAAVDVGPRPVINFTPALAISKRRSLQFVPSRRVIQRYCILKAIELLF